MKALFQIACFASVLAGCGVETAHLNLRDESSDSVKVRLALVQESAGLGLGVRDFRATLTCSDVTVESNLPDATPVQRSDKPCDVAVYYQDTLVDGNSYSIGNSTYSIDRRGKTIPLDDISVTVIIFEHKEVGCTALALSDPTGAPPVCATFSTGKVKARIDTVGVDAPDVTYRISEFTNFIAVEFTSTAVGAGNNCGFDSGAKKPNGDPAFDATKTVYVDKVAGVTTTLKETSNCHFGSATPTTTSSTTSTVTVAFTN